MRYSFLILGISFLLYPLKSILGGAADGALIRGEAPYKPVLNILIQGLRGALAPLLSFYGRIEEQEKAFDEFASEYNGERPHESWNMKTPASLYQPSLKAYPAKVPEIAYYGDFIVSRLRHNGEIRWNGEFSYVSEALVGEPVALQAKSRTSLGNQIQLLPPRCSQ